MDHSTLLLWLIILSLTTRLTGFWGKLIDKYITGFININFCVNFHSWKERERTVGYEMNDKNTSVRDVCTQCVLEWFEAEKNTR